MRVALRYFFPSEKVFKPVHLISLNLTLVESLYRSPDTFTTEVIFKWRNDDTFLNDSKSTVRWNDTFDR